MTPVVSVVIPTRNRVELLTQTIESVRRQDFAAWEALVVDDQSEDETPQVVQQIAAADSRVRYLRRVGGCTGGNACRNQGIRESRGEYILFLDSDDLLEADCLSSRVAYMERHPDLGFAVWPGRVFMETPGDTEFYWNTLSDENDLDRFLRGDVPWQTSGPLWRRAALARVGDWDESLLTWQDWDFHVRALCEAIPYRKLAQPDYSIRRGHKSRISRTRRRVHLVGRSLMLARTAATLEARGLLNGRNRDGLASQFWLLSRQCVSAGRSVRGAIRIWHSCRQVGLVRKGRYLRGLAWLAWAKARGMITGRAWIDRSWPEYVAVERVQQCRAAGPAIGLGACRSATAPA